MACSCGGGEEQAGGSCQCLFVGRALAMTVTGQGSTREPLRVSADRMYLEGYVAAGGTVKVTGSGDLSDPYLVSITAADTGADKWDRWAGARSTYEALRKKNSSTFYALTSGGVGGMAGQAFPQALYAGSSLVRALYAGSVQIGALYENLFTNPNFEDTSLTMFSGGTFARSTAWAASGTNSLNVTVATTYALPTPGAQHTVSAVARTAGQTLGGVAATAAGQRVSVTTTAAVVFGVGFWDEVMVVAGTASPGYFTGATPPKVRRNLITIPYVGGSPWSTGAGTGGTATTAAVDDDRFPNGRATELAWSVAPSSNNALFVSTPSSPVTIGVTYVLSVRFATENWAGIVPAFYAPGGTLGMSGAVSLGNGLYEFWQLWTPTSATSINVNLNPSASSLPAPGAVLRVGGAKLEPGGGYLPYLDGNSSPDPTLKAGWEGSVNNSRSYLWDPVKHSGKPFWSGTANASISRLWGAPA